MRCDNQVPGRRVEAPLLRDVKKDLEFSFGHVKVVASHPHLGASSTGSQMEMENCQGGDGSGSLPR